MFRGGEGIVRGEIVVKKDSEQFFISVETQLVC